MTANVYDIGDQVTLVGVFATRPTRGTVDAGSTSLEVNDATGYAQGNVVLVEGAAVGGETLVTTVSSVAGNVITLSQAAALSVVGAKVGKATNPTTVTCSIREPDGTVSTLSATNVSVGRYEAVFSPTRAGIHYYRFEGTGTAQAAEERDFRVVEKRVV